MPVAWTDLAAERLAKAGYRRGGSRAAVIEVLGNQTCALSAPEIADALQRAGRSVGRASIYRALDELEREGLLTRIELGGDFARFEAHHPDSAHHHHHLVCDECGEIVPFSDDRLERAIRTVAARVDFDVHEHDVTLRGACPDCRAS